MKPNLAIVFWLFAFIAGGCLGGTMGIGCVAVIGVVVTLIAVVLP